jgi:hypothetical protein
MPSETRTGFHPDDTTPIPRPSRYYGRRQNQIAENFRGKRRQAERTTAPQAPPLVPGAPALLPGPIDKSALAIAEPKRLRDKAHLKFVASQPCLVCGRQPSDRGRALISMRSTPPKNYGSERTQIQSKPRQTRNPWIQRIPRAKADAQSNSLVALCAESLRENTDELKCLRFRYAITLLRVIRP